MPGRTPIEESVRPESGAHGLPGCPATGNRFISNSPASR
jgi:hypothetical protein